MVLIQRYLVGLKTLSMRIDFRTNYPAPIQLLVEKLRIVQRGPNDQSREIYIHVETGPHDGPRRAALINEFEVGLRGQIETV